MGDWITDNHVAATVRHAESRDAFVTAFTASTLCRRNGVVPDNFVRVGCDEIWAVERQIAPTATPT